jgi:hypothetical protein
VPAFTRHRPLPAAGFLAKPAAHPKFGKPGKFGKFGTVSSE